jgi:hypothetical protein
VQVGLPITVHTHVEVEGSGKVVRSSRDTWLTYFHVGPALPTTCVIVVTNYKYRGQVYTEVHKQNIVSLA